MTWPLVTESQRTPTIHTYIHIYYAPISGKENDKVAKQNASCGDHTIDAHASEPAITTELAAAHVNHRKSEVLTVSARPDCFRVAKSGYCQPAPRELAVGLLLERKAVQPQPPTPQCYHNLQPQPPTEQCVSCYFSQLSKPCRAAATIFSHLLGKPAMERSCPLPVRLFHLPSLLIPSFH